MVILASNSPRRRELLKYLNLDFEVVGSNVDETITEKMSYKKIPSFLARKKALDVLEKHPNDLIIGADTIVVVNRKVLGKPKDKDDAFKMLELLSGKNHLVISGVCLAKKDKIKTFTCISKVTFYQLSKQEISDYLENDEYKDKAGSYAIQGLSSLFVKKIKGDYYNIVGLPIARLNKELKSF